MTTRRKRRSGGHDDGGGHSNQERWLLTYADMITLLMVLFIVMFAISQVDQKKFATLAEGLAHAFGGTNKVLDGQNGLLSGAHTTSSESRLDPAVPEQIKSVSPAAVIDRAHLEEARKQIIAALKAKGLENSVRFDLDRRGLVVTMVTDHVLFPTGSADLEPLGRQVLAAIAPALAKLPNDVVVEGYTDNVPVTGRYPSNWELSTDRATTVLRFLLDAARLDPRRMSAAGYADTHGLVPNDTAEHRARNRRVQVVVLAQDVAKATGPAADQSVAPQLAPSLAPADPAIGTRIGG